MARIRTVKPEIWMSPQVMNLSHGARLLFLGLITQADDAGRGIADPRKLKAAIFGGDDITSTDVRRWLDELASQRLANLYEDANHGNLYELPSWKSHQSIDRPRESAYPSSKVATKPEAIRRTLDESRTSPREGSDRTGPEGNGREGSGPARASPADAIDFGDRLTQQSADASSDEAWREAGCDETAMFEWLAHKAASGKPLPPHARIHAAKILRGMGDAEVQRTAVRHAIANNWQSLRVGDGRGTQAPSPKGRKSITDTIAELRAAAGDAP